MQFANIKRITVVGAGTMGHGIGQDFARAGYEVILYDLTDEQLRQAKNRIERSLQQFVEWGLLPAVEVQPALSRVRTTTSLEEAAGDADLVIEAVFENLELKQSVFGHLDRLCPERTILASNTSSLMPSMLASATQRPDRVMVVHYFYPPPLMPLVEIVRSEATSDQAIEAVYKAVKQAGKSPIVVQKEALGFLANRLQIALLREALYIVEQGIASAQDVDIAVKQSFGRRLAVAGPLEMAEVQDGWQVMAHILEYILPDLDISRTPSPIVLEKIERGELGPTTGKGFYEWTAESKDAWVAKLSDALAEFMRA